ncbi:MAG: HAMP domain-containing histidine kinase [Clostridia bacterium]|nr:HAMP domain-containing histidine kinase [Clostridia bacterium]
MKRWLNRRLLLRTMNIFYMIAVAMFEVVHRLHFHKSYFNSVLTIIIIELILLLVYLSSSFRTTKKDYQKYILLVFWVITVFNIIVSFNYRYTQFDMLICMVLLLISIESILNMRIFKIFVSLFLVSMGIAYILSSGEADRKIVFILTSMAFITLSFVTRKYFSELYDEYQKSVISQQTILYNANEAFALLKTIYDDHHEIDDFEFVDINPAYEKMFNTSRENEIGKNLNVARPNLERIWFESLKSIVIKNEAVTISKYSKELDMTLLVKVFPAETNHIALLISDISDSAKNKKQIETAMVKLEKSDQMKTQFLRDINHKLRNPLNGMMGMMQLIDYKSLEIENKELFKAVLREMRNSKNVLNQVARFVEIQEIHFMLNEKELISLVTEIVKSYDDEGDITIFNEIGKDVVLEIPEEIITIIIKELIENAIKHTSDNQVDVVLAYETNENGHQSEIHISIKDYGIGISEETMKYIFNEFYHHDYLKVYLGKNKYSLSMCKLLIEKIGGDLIVSENSTEGCTFTIIIPIE